MLKLNRNPLSSLALSLIWYTGTLQLQSNAVGDINYSPENKITVGQPRLMESLVENDKSPGISLAWPEYWLAFQTGSGGVTKSNQSAQI